QNMLTMDLFESAGTTLPAQYGPMPGQMSFTAVVNGTYSLRIKSITGRFGYALSISRNGTSCGAAVCPEPVSSSTDAQKEPSINDLGEIVWSQWTITRYQIFSSTRGQLTFNEADHYGPVINNLGDIAWSEYSWDNVQGQSINAAKAIIAGQPVQLASNPQTNYILGGISDKGEVVWSLYEGGFSQIYSSSRGQLTFDTSTGHDSPSISSQGDIAWSQWDMATGHSQAYKLAAGATVPVAVTSDNRDHFDLSINNSSEIVWSDYVSGSRHLYSTSRGQLTFSQPAGDHVSPSLNNCGDVAFGVFDY